MFQSNHSTIEMVGAFGPFVTALVLAVSDSVQEMDPASIYERWGVGGLTAVGIFFLARWMMAQLEKKDQAMREFVDAQRKATDANILEQRRIDAANQDRLIRVIEEGHAVQQRGTEAINQLTAAIRTSATPR